MDLEETNQDDATRAGSASDAPKKRPSKRTEGGSGTSSARERPKSDGGKTPAGKKSGTEPAKKSAQKKTGSETAKKPVRKETESDTPKKPQRKKTESGTVQKPARKKTASEGAKKPAGKQAESSAAKTPARKKPASDGAKKPKRPSTARKRPAKEPVPMDLIIAALQRWLATKNSGKEQDDQPGVGGAVLEQVLARRGPSGEAVAGEWAQRSSTVDLGTASPAGAAELEEVVQAWLAERGVDGQVELENALQEWLPQAAGAEGPLGGRRTLPTKVAGRLDFAPRA